MRLICNVGRDTFCRVLFKTLNILPLPCIYNADCILYNNERGLEQNSGIIIVHVADQIINPSFLGLIFF